MKKNILIGCIISAIFIFLAVRGINFSDVMKSFRSANYLYVIPIELLMVLSFSICALIAGASF